MSNHTTIRIKEKSFTENVFNLTISFRDTDGSEEEANVLLYNPYNAKTDALLEWYFEQYISKPYDNIKVKDAVRAIEVYGRNLFQTLFTDTLLFQYRTALQKSGPQHITIEVIGDSAPFQAIYWESLRDPEQSHPLAALGTFFIRKNVRPLNIKATVKESPTLNLLIVTARPSEESDVNYRTIQRPLVDLIEKTQTPIQPHILRPGTYEALVRHLDQKAGHYHIIHFDLHGSLLDYASYQYYQKAVRGVTFQNTLYGNNYGLTELKEEEFKEGKKAFIFFESEEKGTAIPVDAGQLASMLEHKQIPICILNACQSAKQDNSAHETSLGRVLMQKGIQLVLAMRYSVSVSAARLMMQRIYEQLYQQKPIEQAIADGRKELYNAKERKALYNHSIYLEDWLLPVVYQNGKPALSIRKFTFEEEEGYFLQQQIPEEARQELRYGFFGRDLDILKIEKNLLLRYNILLLQGMGGAGKTTLLKYIAAWWLRTGFVEKVFYFGYDVKAYTLTEILFYIAQNIYPRTDYGAFTAKLPLLQEDNIVKALKTNHYVLILDNVESITGESLAIPHTLTENERKALKSFIGKLRGGQSLVIIGSRASEVWLKSGTFESNQYVLKGLDQEAASNFANRILQDIEVDAKPIIQDVHFERLMKLLAGYPLALKAILPNLKYKTARRILEELEQGIGDLDKGNEQQRTESIIKCIEYAHSNLSEEAQQLLLCLAPFQSVVNLQPDIIGDYFEELKKEEHFQKYPFDKLNIVVQEAIQNGFMQQAIPDSAIQLMSLQPVFTYFLKNRLNEDSSLQQSLQTAFINYYREQSKTFYQFLNSTKKEEKQLGLFYAEYEYENLYQALILSLDREIQNQDVCDLIDLYLSNNQLHVKRLYVAEMVHEKLHQYSSQRSNKTYGSELLSIKYRLANIYHNLKRFEDAKMIYEQIFEILDENPLASEEPEHIKGQVYQSLGLVSQDLKEYKVAKVYYEKAFPIYVQFNDAHGLAQVYLNLGNLSGEQKEYDSAIGYYQEALQIFVQLNDEYSKGRVYYNLGIALRELKEYGAAKKYFQDALQIFVQFNDVHRQGRVYQNLGVVSEELKEYDAAKESFQNALQIFVQSSDIHSQAQVYQSLSVVSEELKEYNAAKEYNNKALQIFVQFNDVHGQAHILQNLGNVSRKLEEYNTANEYYQKALQIFMQFNDIYSQAQTYANLGEVYRKLEKYNTAGEYYQRALQIFVQFPEDFHSIITMTNIMYNFVKETGDKTFGQTMIQNILPYFESEKKSFLLKVLDDINQL